MSGLEWSIQNGILQIKKTDNVMSKEVYVLSPETGLSDIGVWDGAAVRFPVHHSGRDHRLAGGRVKGYDFARYGGMDAVHDLCGQVLYPLLLLACSSAPVPASRKRVTRTPWLSWPAVFP